MNTIDSLVEQVRLSTDYQINKQILREKILTDLHVAHNGGLFFVTIDLIGFLSFFINLSKFSITIYPILKFGKCTSLLIRSNIIAVIPANELACKYNKKSFFSAFELKI